MTRLFQLIKKNAGFTVLAVNLVLVVVIFFMYDPFNLIATGYAGASPLLKVSQEDAVKIEIQDPENHGASVVLTRKEILQATPSVENGAMDRLERKPKEYRWEIVITAGGKIEQYSADRERIKQFFQSVENVRRYYGPSRTPEKDRELSMAKLSNGQYEGMAIVFTLENGDSHTIYCGKSSLRTNESYVRLDEEDRIYLVQSNLRTSGGSGEPDYFRSRDVMPAALGHERITGLSAIFPDARRSVNLSKSGDAWQIFAPVTGPAKSSEIGAILNDLEGWKASAFPNEIPKNLDKKSAFILEITYTESGNITEVKRARFEVLGGKEFSAYIIRDEQGKMYEISSMYLEDFLNPVEKLLDRRTPGGPGGPPAPGEELR